MQDALTVASYPHLKEKNDRRKVWAVADKLTKFTLQTQPSVYEQLDDRSRILAIGSCLRNATGWLATHPRQAAWLAEAGLSPDYCIVEYNKWHAKQYEATPWRPIRNRKK